MLVIPAARYLPAYAAALRRGYSPSMQRDDARFAELERIESDPAAFLESLDDPVGRGVVRMADGSTAQRLPGFVRWMWDGDIAGSIGLRLQPGTAELPPTCLGHIGYSVVPWKRRRGYGTAALALMLPEARRIGLPYVEVVTDAGNVASQRVITANGGVLVETFGKLAAHGGATGLRYRIAIAEAS